MDGQNVQQNGKSDLVEATAGPITYAVGWLLTGVVLLGVLALALSSSYPSITGWLVSIAGGLVTSSVVLTVYDRVREEKERRRTEAMSRLFIRRAGAHVSQIVNLYCEMHWSGSQIKPLATSKIQALVSPNFKQSILSFDGTAPGFDASNDKYATPWGNYLGRTLRTKLDALDRLYARYQIYLDETLSTQVEQVLATSLPDLLYGLDQTFYKGEGVDPVASLVTQIIVRSTFPLAGPCVEHARDVAELANSFNTRQPGVVEDAPWWLSGQPPRPHGYALLPIVRTQEGYEE
ncbi:hypothetical protein [Pseudomonas sp. UBA2684]|uniref:hypothetical protein n=1 Tax=Pseudomonas sp. UBA2684 TaxID=1947311 RepID=UPI000E9DA85A|nr:hypothetical protein [Pseudomonas sp. UBA2684]HBX56143.1 hypothetical protein [Pseudomonas sp.]|tara:strand:+ start:6781 stop:7653 length:873 start_codon:yes stop_codon:yes gene_type:complete